MAPFGRARCPSDTVSLRSVRRFLRFVAGPATGVLMRVFSRAGHDGRPGSGGQARSYLPQTQARSGPAVSRCGRGLGRFAARSEEHTSELQSLMRISYAVLCLKTKNIPHKTVTITKH